RHTSDVEDHHLRLLLDDLDQHSFHDLMRALRIDSSDDREEENAIVYFDDGGGKLTNRGLMAGHRFEIGRNVSVNRQSHIKKDDFANTGKRLVRLRLVACEVFAQLSMDELKISPVRAEVQLRRHSDALVSGANPQPVAHVIDVVGSREQAKEIRIL